MKNREKFAKEILDIACNGGSIGVDKTTNKPIDCDYLGCNNCAIDGDCITEIKEWYESEYIEKPTITSKEKAFLDLLLPEWKYLARDFDKNKLFLYPSKPFKKSSFWMVGACDEYRIVCKAFDIKFDFIKWEDEEPWSIEDLKKLEVKDV